VVSCDFPNLNAGHFAQFIVTVTVDNGASGFLTNAATVSSPDVSDPNPGNDSDSATFAVRDDNDNPTDLGISKAALEGVVNPGDQNTYTLNVVNFGDDEAHDVTVIDKLPEHTSFVSVNPAADCSESGGTVTCNFGTVGPQENRAITIAVQVDNSPGGYFITNHAQALTTSPDSPPENNDSQATFAVSTPNAADVSVTKTTDNDFPNQGENVTFSLHVHNDGPDTAHDVSVADFAIQYDMVRPTGAIGATLDIQTKVPQPAVAPVSIQVPLGLEPALTRIIPPPIVRPSGMGLTQTADLQTASQAIADRSSWSVVASGKVGPDVGVLRPGGLVNVRGAGRLFNGSYFVTRVQHVIDAGGYVQSFEAERNAVTMTGAELYVLP
jgi:uncharacterized repeat protein (TIGR01451 family)